MKTGTTIHNIPLSSLCAYLFVFKTSLDITHFESFVEGESIKCFFWPCTLRINTHESNTTFDVVMHVDLRTMTHNKHSSSNYSTCYHGHLFVCLFFRSVETHLTLQGYLYWGTYFSCTASQYSVSSRPSLSSTCEHVQVNVSSIIHRFRIGSHENEANVSLIQKVK